MRIPADVRTITGPRNRGQGKPECALLEGRLENAEKIRNKGVTRWADRGNVERTNEIVSFSVATSAIIG